MLAVGEEVSTERKERIKKDTEQKLGWRRVRESDRTDICEIERVEG